MTSSSYNRNYPPHEGRLLSDKWWQPGVHERGQFLMVDLQRLTVVRQSLVQGGRDSGISGARVLSYLIYHSINGETWFPILEREHVKVERHLGITCYVHYEIPENTHTSPMEGFFQRPPTPLEI